MPWESIDVEALCWIRLFSRGSRSSATWGLRGLPGLSIFHHRAFQGDLYTDMPEPGWVVDYMEGEQAPWEINTQDPAFLIARALVGQRFVSRSEAMQAIQATILHLSS